MIIMKKVTFRWLLHCGHTGTILQNLKKPMEILHFWYQNAIFPCGQRLPCPYCRPPFWGVQNSIISIKNQLNFEVTFTCHFEPLYSPTWLQLSPNLASKIRRPKGRSLRTPLKQGGRVYPPPYPPPCWTPPSSDVQKRVKTCIKHKNTHVVRVLWLPR